jgi:two-component system, chemotaxis family, chemotaxis protein CheY
MSKILVADDSQVFLDLLVHTLEDHGYTDISTAKDGKEALDFAQEIDFDIILTDLHMPRMDGVDIISLLRTMPKYENIPILLITTEDQQDMKVKAKNVGATGWISKPFIPAQLIKAINYCLK